MFALFSWVFLFIVFWLLYFFYPNLFNIEYVKFLYQEQKFYFFAWFILISALRGFLFIPSTALIFIWALFFDPVLLFFVSILWIVISSTLVFYFSEYMWFDTLIKNKTKKERIKKLEDSINKNWYRVVTIWAFFPFLPTDLICYVAWTAKMAYRKFLAWLLTWEIPLVIIYILSFKWIMKFII